MSEVAEWGKTLSMSNFQRRPKVWNYLSCILQMNITIDDSPMALIPSTIPQVSLLQHKHCFHSLPQVTEALGKGFTLKAYWQLA